MFPFLVLFQIGLAVSLVERGKVCAHWWPNMTLFLNHFYASMTEDGSLPEHANLWGLGLSPSIGLSIRKTNQRNNQVVNIPLHVHHTKLLSINGGTGMINQGSIGKRTLKTFYYRSLIN